MRLLVRFGKDARLRFISHLDLQRFLHMALNRTGLPIRYSQGFNPHPIMAFGSALGLYQTSEYEIVDIGLSAPMGRKRCEDAMRAALPVDMPIYEVRLVDDRFPSVMAQIKAADWKIRMDEPDMEKISAAIDTFMASETITAMKKTKSGEKEINIRPLVLKLSKVPDGFDVRLMLTEKESLKPNLLVESICRMAGIEVPEVRIHRVCLYVNNAEGALVPAMEL